MANYNWQAREIWDAIVACKIKAAKVSQCINCEGPIILADLYANPMQFRCNNCNITYVATTGKIIKSKE